MTIIKKYVIKSLMKDSEGNVKIKVLSEVWCVSAL